MFLKALIVAFSIQFVSVALTSVQKDKNVIFLFIQLIVYCYELWCKQEKWTLSNCNTGLGWQEFSLIELMSHRLKCHYKCAFLHVVKSRDCILWKQLKKPQKSPKHRGFITASRTTKKILYYLEHSMQKIALLALLGTRSSAVCHPLARTVCLTLVILNLGLTAKVSSCLLTWLECWTNFVSCFQQQLMADDQKTA